MSDLEQINKRNAEDDKMWAQGFNSGWNSAIEAAAKLIEYPAEDGKMYAATIRTLKK